MVPEPEQSQGAPRRKPVPKRTRYEVLRRDDHACRYCGARAPEAELTVDHVTPVVLGGTDHPSNLVAACKDCNFGKGSAIPDGPLVADVAQDALRWSAAMRWAAIAAAAERSWRDSARERFFEAWSQWRWGPDEDRRAIPLDMDWPESIDRFLAAGLAPGDLDEAVRVAMRAPVAAETTWRYFCGVCWRMLRDRQEVARRLLVAEEGEHGQD